jgi:hypothetical protein
VIGQPRLNEPLADQADDERRWPVSMAYYELATQSDTPKFEASFLLGEDGVLRDLVLDYGDFKLKGELEQLDLLERPDC